MNRTEEEIALRAQAQQAALFALLKTGVPTAGSDMAWRALTEAAAKTLGVRRVSVWLLSPDRQRLCLADLYEKDRGRHSAGIELRAEKYPAYFHALRWSRAIVAPDAAGDPRTREFGEEYLDGNRIRSMLDAGIWQGGEARGVVCLESVDERRDWTIDEQQFTASIADLAAAVLNNETVRSARARLQESEELFSRAFHASPDWMTIVRISDGRILHVNDTFCRMSGYAAHEAVGHTGLELQLWADNAQRDEWLRKTAIEGRLRDFEAVLRTRDGRLHTVELSCEKVDLLGDECVISICRDVTDRRRQERLVQAIAHGVGGETGEAFFRALVGHLADALETDVALVGELDPANPGGIRTLAVRRGALVAPNYAYALRGSPCEIVLAGGICAYSSRVWERFPDKSGIESYVGVPLLGAHGEPVGIVSVLFRRPVENTAIVESMLRIFASRAAAELERAHHLRELERLAMYDSLTSLPNRLLLQQRLEQALARGAAAGTATALLLVDLDRFKEVNDTLGHHVGDVLLERIARRLEQEMGAHCGALVARLGGDEFALLIEDAGSEVQAEGVAARALAVLTEPFDLEGYRLGIGASIGIAISSGEATGASGLLRCADVAMYAAKRQGVGFASYDRLEDPYSAERLELLSELGAAARRGEMVVHYQPRVALQEGRLRGFEALVRWNHPRLGLLGPDRFIPLAELTDAIRPLTLWILDEVLRTQCAWTTESFTPRMSVNLSARHLLDDSVPEQIARLVETHGANPAYLELEITESALINDPERATATLLRVRALGVQVAVDDFGTGYSSLSHLKRLPLHALKIDVSFVTQMLHQAQDRVIVESTIGLAHSLGLSVVAEGIEDEDTLQVLRDLGCNEGQGYFIARPMDREAAAAWMREGRWSPV